MYEPTELEFSFLAGIIEGEGCVYIGSHSQNAATGANYFVTAIQVVNTDERLIDWICKRFRGLKASYTRKQIPKASRKMPYMWKITGKDVDWICEKCLPYMVAKRDQIEVMQEMRRTYLTHPSQREKTRANGIQPLSQDLIDLRFSYLHKLRELRS